MDHGHHLYCLMNSGKPLTETICDALLYNAYDMYQEKRNVQRIKSRTYDGMIETDLEVVDFSGMAVVSFLANISTDQYEHNEVRFVVRLEDFDGIPEGEWQQLELRVVDVFDDDDYDEKSNFKMN